MAGRDSSKGAHCYELETAGTGWAENVTTFGTRTPIAARIDTTQLKQAKLKSARVVQLLNGGVLCIPGPMVDAKFKVAYELCGHGSVTSGAVAATVVPTLLKEVLGYAPAAPAGTTCQAGWTATGGNVAASGTFPAGWVAFFGARRDGRSDGQPAIIGSHIGSAVTLLNALPVTPPNNGDVVHSCELVHQPATPTDARMDIQSTRHILFTADQVYRCHGCFATGFEISGLGAGAVPMLTIEFTASYFVESTATFPSALSTDNFVAAVNAGGSMHVQTKGVTTRDLVSYRGDSLAISVDLGVRGVKGPGGVWDEQIYVAARRVPGERTITFNDDADSATLTPKRLGQWQAENYYTLLLALNLRPGKRMGIVGVNACFMGDRPVQGATDDLNTIASTFRLDDDDAGATELAKSGLRVFFG